MRADPDALIEALAAGLTPVQARTPARNWAAFALLAAVEVAAYLAVAGMRPDMGMAMGRTAFWWKALSLVVLAGIGIATAIAALRPDRSPRRGLRLFGIAAAVAIAVGWGLDAAHGAAPDQLALRLDWREGLACLGEIVVLALPALGILALLMRRGAPTDPSGAATAAGAAAAAWGGAVFTFACPHDDPFYIAVWFALSIGVVMAVARLLLPKLTRW